ncbi:hypothetical protein [Thalassobacillus hwangdonensis]|uniref:Tetratricopeptide repeat protein n=1 Tax=Thalassobacillus hwangdonensis TaxID=546108 RepID=A0ABW3KZC7_9BACI
MSEQEVYTHKQLAVQAFNSVWDLIEKENRTKADEEEMIHMCHASFWHWTKVEDHTAANLSIGYWQLSRVYAISHNGAEALSYAESCVDVSEGGELEPVLCGYAYEALARSLHVLGREGEALEALKKAEVYKGRIADQESRNLLEADFATITE